MSVTRPPRYTRPEPMPEDLFNITVAFTDDEPDIHISEVKESELVAIYQHIGENEARVRLQPSPGHHYFTAARRIKHVTASLVTEKENNA